MSIDKAGVFPTMPALQLNTSFAFLIRIVESGLRRLLAWITPRQIMPMTVLALSACGPMTKIAALSDTELRTELAECHSIANPSNSKAIGCQNFKRECEKRVKQDGRY